MSDQQLDLATWLAELEAQRAQLDLMIAGVRQRLGQPVAEGEQAPAALPGQLTSAPQTGRIRQDEFFRMKIPDAIKKYLHIMKQPQTPKTIEEALKTGGLLTNSKDFYATLSTALKRLKEADVVVNTTNGWGLAEWYPSKPKGPDEKPKKGKGRGKAGKAPKAKPGTESASAPKSAYHVFLAEAMKGGKTMAQAAEEWRKQKNGAEGAPQLTVA